MAATGANLAVQMAVGKIMFKPFLVIIALAIGCSARSASQSYPHILDEPPKSRMDQTLGHPTDMELYDVKYRELAPIMKAARIQSEKAAPEEISKAGISFATLRGNSAREAYKDKLIETLVHQRNLELVQKMNSLPVPASKEQGTVTTLTHQQIKETAASIEFSPANDDRQSLNDKYNPNRDIGYCFLRAHYYAGAAYQRGLDMTSVRKVFLVGTMKLFGARWAPIDAWRYHVATAVRGTDGKWYVLDNHMAKHLGKHGYSSRAFTVEEWYKYYERFMNMSDKLDAFHDGSKETAHSKALFLYFADADRVIPEGMPYTKELFYGVDQNKNGQLDPNEIQMGGAFIDVDQFLDVKIHPCSKERYEPLNPMHENCRNMTADDAQVFRKRELLVNKWRMETA